MVNPGTFQGSRGRFLLAQSDIYASAVADGRINDAVADIQRRYLKRYPMSIPHDQEPTQQWLDQVNDDEPDPDPVEPDWDSLDAESAKALHDERAREAELLKARKDAIKRRLHYIYSKNRDKSSSRDRGNLDPQPRKKTPYNVWGPKNRDRVDPVFTKRVKELGADASQHAAIRSAVYKELFEELPAATKEHWAHVAEEEHHNAITALKQKKNQGISTAPKDRQQVITSISKVIEPVLDMLGAHTGWKFSLIGGGPEPADAGRLNMVVIHSGVLPGTVKMDFGAAERDALKNQIIPGFGRFLKRSYTMAECRSRALPDDHSFISLNDMVLDEDNRLQLHSFEFDDEHRAVSQVTAESQKGKRLFEGVTSQGKKSQQPQSGTPSPQVRPTPGKAKRAQRILPNSDGNPRNYRPLTPSPLSQTSITASQIKETPASTSEHRVGLDGADKPQAVEVAAGADHTPAAPSQTASLPIHTGTPSATPAPPPASLSDSTRSVDTAVQSIPAVPLAMPTPPATPLQLSPSFSYQPFSPAPVVRGSSGSADAGGIPPPARPTLPHPTLVIATPPSTPPVRSSTLNAHFDGIGTGSGADESAAAAHSTEGSPTPSLPPSPVPSRSSSPVSQTDSVNHETAVSETQTPLQPDPAVDQHSVIQHAAASLNKPAELARQSSRRPSGTATVPRPEDMELDEEPKGRKRKANNAASQTPAPTKRLKGAVMPRSSSSRADSSPTQRAFEVEVPDGCPAYLSKGVGLLTREHLGLSWKQLVEAWLVFEEKARFGEGTTEKKLPASGRPQEIADWIKNARKPNFTPKISNIDKFSSKYLSWWRGIQPEWRLGGADGDLLREGGNWDAIACSGANGMLSALAALFFWGSECSKQGASLTQWHAAVEDACVAVVAATSELA